MQLRRLFATVSRSERNVWRDDNLGNFVSLYSRVFTGKERECNVLASPEINVSLAFLLALRLQSLLFNAKGSSRSAIFRLFVYGSFLMEFVIASVLLQALHFQRSGSSFIFTSCYTCALYRAFASPFLPRSARVSSTASYVFLKIISRNSLPFPTSLCRKGAVYLKTRSV